MSNDERWMRHALTLAERGRGAVEPNPLVGAVIARNDEFIADGWHATFGDAHAETVALQRAGERSRGATLYVTLEPCSHFGKTPPCADAVIAAGIGRVVVAMVDPFPQVAGQGIAKLQSAGIEVVVRVCEAEARRLNRSYLALIEKGRPYVHLKWAMTLDGKLATRTGDSQWISSEGSRKIVHQLRGRMDAIIVGAGTVRKDDPLLTARPPGPRTATRVVLATSGDISADSQLMRTARDAPVLIATCGEYKFDHANVETLVLPRVNDHTSVAALMTELGRRRMTNVLVEGGAEVLGSFRDAGLVDEVHVFIATKLAGGCDASSAIGGIGVERIAEALPIRNWQVQTIDDDIYVHGCVIVD